LSKFNNDIKARSAKSSMSLSSRGKRSRCDI